MPHRLANWGRRRGARPRVSSTPVSALLQMEVQRRAGQGRLAEIIGPDVEDRSVLLARAWPLPAGGIESSPRCRRRHGRDCRPMPTGSASFEKQAGALSPEFLILGDTPEAWKPGDSVIWQLLALQLGHNYKIEMIRAKLARKLPPGQENWIFPASGGAIFRLRQRNRRLLLKHSGIAPRRRTLALAAVVLTALQRMGGCRFADDDRQADSSSWNDPHLDLGAPILWVPRASSPRRGSAKGATLPGQPAILLGQNDAIAWGFTNADTDVQDLFIETVDPINPGRT